MQDLCERILNKIAKSKRFSRILLDIIKSFTHLRPTITPDSQGTFSVSVKLDETPHIVSLDDVFNSFTQLKRSKPLIISFDEFQDVALIKDADSIFARMRGIIQHQKSIGYIFCGSRRTLLNKIFLHSDSPLFKSVVPFPVGPILPDELFPFISSAFAQGKRKVSHETLNQLYSISNAITGDILQLCEAAWTVTNPGNIIDADVIGRALNKIFQQQSCLYETWIHMITGFQLNVLKGIAAMGGTSVYAKQFRRSVGIDNPSTLTKALSRLEDLDILFREGNEYHFVYPFLKEWLLRNYI